MNLKHFSEEEQQAFKEKHELAEPKEWAVMDDSIVFTWCDTEEEAKAELKEANIGEEVYDEFCVWLEEQVLKHSISEDKIKSIIFPLRRF